ncbi:MAG: hypothetical protein UHU19_01590 [Lachnospiraceae bacterium]|nr:hypothetical protein [Lachnospiraceae bacterium]
MQNLKEFTRKSSKVAGAILSAAMVTSMIVGTNVVQAAEVNTQIEADVNANVHVDTETAERVAKDLMTELKSLKVISSKQIETEDKDGLAVVTDNKLTKIVKKVAEENSVTGDAIELKVDTKAIKQPTEDKDGKLTVKIFVDGNKKGEVDYTLPSGKEREATTKEAIEKYIDGLTVTNDNIKSFLDNVQDYLDSQKDGDFQLYPETKVSINVYDPVEAIEEENGYAKAIITAEITDGAEEETIGKIKIDVNKTVKTYDAIKKEAAEALDKYLGEVKYFGASDVETQAAAVIEDFVTDKYEGTITFDEETDLDVTVVEPATEKHDGSAIIKYTLTAADGSTSTDTKEVVLPNADTKTKQVMADLKTVATAMTVTTDTKAEKYPVDFEEKFKENFKEITIGTVEIDKEVYGYVYGSDVEEVQVKLAKGDTENPSIAFFTVKIKGADEVTDRYVYTAKEEETHKPGKGTLPDGRPCIYGNDGKPLTGFIQANENGDANDNNTYFAGNDGHLYVDQLTYAQNGKDILYFDAEGHMAFDKFIVAKKDMNGNALSGNPIYFFNSEGRMYINQTTYGSGKDGYDSTALYYINEYGVLQQNGWYRTADGNITYAAADGKLTTSKWGIDQFGRKVYFQANGFLAKGTITDGVKYYQLDADDGHLISEF